MNIKASRLTLSGIFFLGVGRGGFWLFVWFSFCLVWLVVCFSMYKTNKFFMAMNDTSFSDHSRSGFKSLVVFEKPYALKGLS